jgi:molybdopterin/thiamine biosynthesis adenylyltransferase
MSVELSRQQSERYRRHIVFDSIRLEGQQKLLVSKALVAGLGGLGSPAALYLASCGVGTIGLADSDDLELSNLHRQILYSTEDIGKPKVQLAEKRLSALNPDIKILTYQARLNRDNLSDIAGGYDIILECSDNFDTKYLLNDTCVRLGKPLVFGGIYRYEGKATFILPGQGPCFRCLFPEPPAPGIMLPPQEAGMLGSVPGVIGAIQATEALKFLIGGGPDGLLVGRLLRYDAKRSEFSTLNFSKDVNCRACGGG